MVKIVIKLENWVNFSEISDFLTFLKRTANLIMISVLNDVFWGCFGAFSRV